MFGFEDGKIVQERESGERERERERESVCGKAQMGQVEG